MLADARARIDAAELPLGVSAAPLTPAELRVLRYLPTHLSFAEIADEVFVSRNTVKTQAIAVYRKLGVTSRAAAVDRATRRRPPRSLNRTFHPTRVMPRARRRTMVARRFG